MQSSDGIPMVCVGSTVWLNQHTYAIALDQTPVQVREMLADGEGLVEFTYSGVAAYIDANAPITVIQPRFAEVS